MMKRMLIPALILTILIGQAAGEEPATPAIAAEADTAAVEAIGQPVDLVICLDTSGSMTGLIESAKQKLWAVVNELATAKPRPVLRVALYHYGTPSLGAETGYVKQLCPLTNDLDTVYGKLFELRTSGGSEYVARVIRAATLELEWSENPKAVHILFVAGNERATQDPKYKLEEMCKAAIAKGIMVNTIHCGAEATGRSTGWADAAKWTDGRFANIDQNSGTVVIATPFDKKLSELGGKLNETYIPYGKRGLAGARNQVVQDGNASKLNPAAAAARTVSKGGALYRNSSWDLVDAPEEKDFDLEKIKTDDLPEAMQKMSVADRKAHIEKQSQARKDIQEEIKKLGEQRDTHIKKEMASKGLKETDAFDYALRQAVREQAEKNGMTFETKPE